MKETIYSIPINESFEVLDGQCPVCRLHKRLNTDSLEYVLGPAMMEPDVRQRTNAQGFCADHLAELLKLQKRLPLALVLETHFQALLKSEKHLLDTSSCYVCNRVGGFLTAYYSNILYLWRTEESFRKKWEAQPVICRPHTAALTAAAPKELSKKENAEFSKSLMKKTAAAINEMAASLAIFIKSFDHRFADEPLGEHKQAVQNAIAFLSGPKGGEN